MPCTLHGLLHLGEAGNILLSTWYVSGIVLGTGDSAVNKSHLSLPSWNFYSYSSLQPCTMGFTVILPNNPVLYDSHFIKEATDVLG